MSVTESKNYWLMKSEPESYSIDQLKKDKTTWWSGVRNYQARNFMTQSMKVGDWVLFYHSNAELTGVAGLAQISAAALPDATQFDKKSDFYDPKASKEKPNWFCVEVKFAKKFPRFVSLPELKAEKALAAMLLLKRGQRLSIQPVTEQEFRIIENMGGS